MKKLILFLSVFVLGFFISVNFTNAEVAGCGTGDLFSRTTGQSCGITNTPTDCKPGDLFSSVTGKPCNTTSVAQNDNFADDREGAPAVFTKDLSVSLRSRGPEVLMLQQFLKNKGFFSGKVDGVFGRITGKAVGDFQEYGGLKRTEMVDEVTRALLNHLLPTLTSEISTEIETSRIKSADASIKANIANSRVEAEISYDKYNSYTQICSIANILKAISIVETASGSKATCLSGDSSWALSVPLKSNSSVSYCADSTGFYGNGKATSANGKNSCGQPTTATPTIDLLSPNGGEVYKVGGSLVVKFNAVDFTTTGSIVYIELRPWNSNVGQVTKIAIVDSKDSSYTWQIPSSVAPGQYRVEIYIGDPYGGINPDGDKDISDAPFTITASSTDTTYHPADTNKDFKISIVELTAYAKLIGSSTEKTVVSATNIYQKGEKYVWDSVKQDWVSNTATQSLVITTSSLPNARAGQPYATTLNASGGDSSNGYVWSVDDRFPLNGLSFLKTNGNSVSITGNPADVYLGGVKQTVSYTFTFNVTVAYGSKSVTKEFSLTVDPAINTDKTYHPADTNKDLRINIAELTAYLKLIINSSESTVVSATNIYQKGEAYRWDATTQNWVPATTTVSTPTMKLINKTDPSRISNVLVNDVLAYEVTGAPGVPFSMCMYWDKLTTSDKTSCYEGVNISNNGIFRTLEQKQIPEYSGSWKRWAVVKGIKTNVAEYTVSTMTNATPSLSVSKGVALGNPTYSRGSVGAKIGSYNISTSTTDGVKVSSITVGMGTNANLNYTNVKLLVDGVQFGTTTAVVASGGVYTFNRALTIPASSVVAVDVYADISSGAVTQSGSATTISACAGNGVTSNTFVSCNYTYGQSVTISGSTETVVKPSITVLSPNGGESFEFNKSLPVRWSSTGLASTQYVKVRLKSAADAVGVVLGQTTVGAGSQTIIANAVPGSGYAINIEAYESSSFSAGSPVASDQSDGTFTITAALPAAVNGGWSAWSPVSCPTICGLAASTQTRTCTNPAPVNGGASCSGEASASCPATAACSVTLDNTYHPADTNKDLRITIGEVGAYGSAGAHASSAANIWRSGEIYHWDESTQNWVPGTISSLNKINMQASAISAFSNTEPNEQAVSPAKFHFTQFLEEGSYGNEVRELQKFLNGAGYNVGNIDGAFGPKVKEALTKFQTDNHLKPDGILGYEVRTFLNK